MKHCLVMIFFITRLPFHILSIYINITSNTYSCDQTNFNKTQFESTGNRTHDHRSSILGDVMMKMF